MSELASAALAASKELSPAELHGTVCGMMVANIRARGLAPEGEDGSPVFSVSDYVELVGADAVSDAETVEDFAQLSLAALDAEDLSFQPLLPDDEDPLAARVEALGEWAAAFLAGFGAAVTLAPGETAKEVLEDLAAISAVDHEVDESEDGERQLTELVEYVRVGVLLLLRPDEEEES